MSRHRHNFTKGQLLQGFETCGGKCAICNRKIFPGQWEGDHILAVALGGKSEPENLQIICTACHKLKTHQQDRPMIAKADRQAKAHHGMKPRKGPPMLGTKASGWKRKMNGEVVRR